VTNYSLVVKKIPYILGIEEATVEELKSFCASIATYGGTPLFHMENITPEYNKYPKPTGDPIIVTDAEMEKAEIELNDATEIDFLSIGCPHASIQEIILIAKFLENKKVNSNKTLWITTGRPTKKIADQAGYTEIIERAGGIFAADTCCVVAPIKGRWKGIMSDSAKMVYYARSRHKMKAKMGTIQEILEEATK
jgi:predicted aconitase